MRKPNEAVFLAIEANRSILLLDGTVVPQFVLSCLYLNSLKFGMYEVESLVDRILSIATERTVNQQLPIITYKVLDSILREEANNSSLH